jgi:hypothetical protein
MFLKRADLNTTVMAALLTQLWQEVDQSAQNCIAI